MALSMLVLVHEFGHFITARLFKTRVEKFYMFFDWSFSLFRCKKIDGKWHFRFFAKNNDEEWKTDDDGTEFGIGWLPLGGYCKIAGMIDESMDLEQMKQPAKEWEFRSKKPWQRLIVMVGGVVMNIIFAFIVYIGLLSAYGELYLPTAEVNKYGITVDSVGMELGLRDGDKILNVDGKEIENFEKIPMTLLLEDAQQITVEREGQVVELPLPENTINKLLKVKNSFISPRMPFVIQDFAENSEAKKVGLQVDDQVIALNGISTPYFQDFQKTVRPFGGQTVEITVVRGGVDTLLYNVPLSAEATLGVYAKQMLEFKTYDYSLLQSIPRGMSKTTQEIGDYWKQLKLIFDPSTGAYENLGGFIAIGNVFPGSFDWYAFWRMTAFISIILAVMNILPIPALDGGHVLFLLYEIITRRKPSDKFMEVAQYVGLFIILALVIYANGNDIIKLLR